jgi:protein-S-isoprenylcysteine O-methyltransferase Ste14
MTKEFSIRQGILYALVAGMVLLARPALETFVAGSALAFLGIALRVWACGYLQKNKRVVSSGPYARVQHPLYLGTAIITLGAILAGGSTQWPAWLIWALIGPAFFTYFYLIYFPKKQRVEGDRLERRFGEEYARFRREVPPFLPALRRWAHAEREPWSLKTLLSNHELEMDLLIAALFAALWLPGRLF